MLLAFLVLIIPPFSLIFIMIAFSITLGSLYFLKYIYKIKSTDLSSKIFPNYIKVCFLELLFIYVTMFSASALSLILPIITEVNDEWWPNTPHSYLSMILFINMWLTMHFVPRLYLIKIFNKVIINKTKSVLYSLSHIGLTSLIYAAILLFILI